MITSDFVSHILTKHGCSKVRWFEAQAPLFGLFTFCNKTGAVELIETNLKLYLYFGIKHMEIFNEHFEDPDFLYKLQVTLADQKQAIDSESVLI